jgi:hypothetical protein
VGGEIGIEEHFSATAKRVTQAKSYMKVGVGASILFLEVLASCIQKLVKMEQIHTKTLKTGPGGTQTCPPLAFSYKSWQNPIRAKQVSCHVGP